MVDTLLEGAFGEGVDPRAFIEEWLAQLAQAVGAHHPSWLEGEVELGLNIDGEGGGRWLCYLDRSGAEIEAGSAQAPLATIHGASADWPKLRPLAREHFANLMAPGLELLPSQKLNRRRIHALERLQGEVKLHLDLAKGDLELLIVFNGWEARGRAFELHLSESVLRDLASGLADASQLMGKKGVEMRGNLGFGLKLLAQLV